MRLQIPPGTFRAYLFDCDGTVVDSMPLHYIAWKQALGEWGCTFDEELFYSWGGKPPVEIIAALNQMQGLNMPVEAVAERKENLYFSLLPELKPIPEVLEHIDAQHGRFPLPSSPAAPANRSSNRSPPSACSIASPSSSAPRTTRAPSPLPTHFSSPPRASASRPKTAWSLKTPRWAFRPQPPPAWLPCAFPSPASVATEPRLARLRKLL